MKTTIQSPATSAGSSSTELKKTTITSAHVEYIAVGLAAIGFLMMATASESDIVRPMIGCGMIVVAAAIAVKNRKGGQQ